MTEREALAAGIVALGLDLGVAIQEQLLAYLTLLEKWNRTYNLTAIRDRETMVSHHLLDSLAVLPHLPASAGVRLIDIGSGGGLPGIPLAVAHREWRVTLLDGNRKKSAFLRQVVAELKLTHAELVTARAEAFAPAEPFDVVIARAFSDLAQLVAVSAHLLAPRGRVFAMKAAYPQAEIAALPPDTRVVAVPKLDVPGIEAERHLVIMEPRSA
jgi:16S rRNA (guanine527-N7)-methyltransferase